MTEKYQEITIDPRVFINAPFVACPKCQKKSFGVLSIYGYHCSRRCRECWYTENFDLPPLNKKIIYVDQFAISEMMKVLNPDSLRRRKSEIDDFWLELFRRLDRLGKLQLTVCPDSEIHRHESMAAGQTFYKAAKRMYEQLSGGLTFHPPSWIEQIQLGQHIALWSTDKAGQPLLLQPEDALMGELNQWWDHLRVSVESVTPQDWINDLRQANKNSTEQLAEVADRWRKKPLSLDDHYLEEVHGYGRSKLKEWVESALSDSIVGFISTMGIMVTMRVLRNALQGAGVKDDEADQKIIEYLNSDELRHVPFINIQAGIYATAAAKIASGQKKPLKGSLLSDANMLGAYLPYCDAMFLDKEMAGYVSELQKAGRIPFKTRIFSRRTAKDFFAYLDDLEANTPKGHLEKVGEVYGDTWATPYEEMYKYE